MAKHCRDFSANKPDPSPATPKIRLCKNCHEKATKFGMIGFLLSLARRGFWVCPFGKPECGKKQS